MDKKALQLCSRFALQPNLLGYCGRESAPAKLKDCIVEGKCASIVEELEKFIVLNPYLQAIAQITGKPPFSYEVIESYWLGNDLLKQIKPEHYDLLVDNLAKQGVPVFLIEEIKTKKPKDFVPIHLFNILHVGVGKASGSVPFNLESINNCMVRWGRIISIRYKVSNIKYQESNNSLFKEGKVQNCRKILSPPQLPTTNYQLLTTQTVKLTHTNGKYEPVESVEELPYLPELVGELKVGDNIALHWGWVAGKIKNKEMGNIKYWTEKLLDSI